jgi:hypothetical protein
MAEQLFTGSGITAPKSLGYEPNPELEKINQEIASKHLQENASKAEALMNARLPTATPEDNIKAGQALKDVAGSNEVRWADLLGAQNFGDIYKAITGGADVRTEAFDEKGNKYFKVFNQRIGPSTPNGEFRRYETVDGKQLTPEQEAKIGSITSLTEVPLTQRNFFMANQVAAKDVAAAQAADWNKLTRAGAAAIASAPAIRDFAIENKNITKQLLSSSINPATRILLAGANEIRTGNTQEIQNSANRMNRFLSGEGTNKDFEDFKKTSGGISAGFNYQEGKGLTKRDGSKANTEDIKEAVNNAMSAASSSSAVVARKEDMLAKAQLLAAEGKIQNIDLIQRYINNQAKLAALIEPIEAAGGIKIAKPNLQYSQGDSFSLAHTKAELDEMYADLAENFGQKVQKAQQEFGKSTPPIGTVERELSSDATIKQRKDITASNIQRFLQENTPVLEKVNTKPVNPQLLNQPERSKISAASAPPEMPAARGPANSRPPVTTPAAPQGRRPLSNIFGG